jgi:cbb3-type cytochrome oxidase subunit 1
MITLDLVLSLSIILAVIGLVSAFVGLINAILAPDGTWTKTQKRCAVISIAMLASAMFLMFTTIFSLPR